MTSYSIMSHTRDADFVSNNAAEFIILLKITKI